MPDSDRPRRPVPAWVTAPYVEGAQGSTVLEAPLASATTAPAAQTAGSTPAHGTPVSAPAPLSAPDAAHPEIVVPDYMPSEEHLPPAPTSPTVHTRPFDRATEFPAPVSPVDAAAATTPGARPDALVGAGMSAPAPTAVHAGPIVPRTGQPRFSVPGLEHLVVDGTDSEPSGPVGYRTPRRFAHQQGAVAAAAVAPTPTTSSTQVLAAPPVTAPAVSAPSAAGTATAATGSVEAEPSLPSGAPTGSATRRAAIGATPGAVFGAVAALATTGLAAWWFTAPATVHVVGLVLGLIALVCSVATLRNPAVTWQRPVALLGAVLGGVGTLVLLWAVASAVLPMAGVTLPDITGTGVVPTLAP
ncbi:MULTISPECIES: hypothetical protein [unclassified Curtobacterium]|uniref:hypothetical protein n=1 Tax=unclassified Curtobacterium TaxID=257496 RepID=UPI00226B73C6|nr:MULTISPECIES: hypothetical protein [unclassified Curtobacterium]